VTKKDVGDIFLHVGGMTIGHQQNNMPEYDVDFDVDNRFVMLETFFLTW